MTTIESVKARVQHLFECYAQAIVSGDEILWASLWDEKAVQLPPGDAAIFGRRAIAKRFREHCCEVAMEFTVNTEEVRTAGDLAFARGTMLSSAVPRGGGPREFGYIKFLTIFRRQSDGTWRIFRECRNGNGPVHRDLIGA